MIKTISTFIFLLLFVSNSNAAPSYTIKGKISHARGYRVLLVAKDGSISMGTVTRSGNFTIKAKSIKNSSLQLLNAEGRYAGPVLVKRVVSSKRGYSTLSGVLPTGTRSKTIDVGKVKLGTGFGFLSKALESKVIGRKVVRLTRTGSPVGAGTLGIPSSVVPLRRAITLAASEVQQGEDSDGDGVPNSIDADDDNDGILDGSDDSSPGAQSAIIPYSTLYLSMSETLNQNIAPLTQSAIDAVIGGEDKFVFAFFLARREGVSGAHVVCPPSLAYCARSTGSAVYSGLSESADSLRGTLWASYNADGSGYPNLEPISVGGSNVFAAGVQPRVGTNDIRPGDTYIVEFTNGNRVVSRSTATLPPYFVTTPALHSFSVNGVDTTIDYTSQNIPGSNNSNAITVPSGQLLTLSFYRPQISMPSTSGPRFVDNGHLNYGLLINGEGVSREFTCGGHYSSLSSTLSEVSSLGAASSPFSQDGATLWPLVDSADDGSSDAANLMSVTVDLAACLDRAGVSRGTYQLALTAAGVPLTGGANRAAQMLSVRVQ